PVRVVLDGRLRVSPAARVFAGGRALVATGARAPAARVRALAEGGAGGIRFPGARVPAPAPPGAPAARSIPSGLVEGGAETHATFVEAGLCDRLLLFVAPRAFGGAAPVWLGGDGAARIAAAPRFRFDGPPRRLGDDLLVEAVMLEICPGKRMGQGRAKRRGGGRSPSDMERPALPLSGDTLWSTGVSKG